MLEGAHDLFLKVRIRPELPNRGYRKTVHEWIRWSDISRVREEAEGSLIITRRGDKIRCHEDPTELFKQITQPHRFGETQFAQ